MQPATLDTLALGETCVVVRLDSTGAERDRMMDLGILPGTRITAEMRAPLGEPTAYRIRGALVALRPEQARLIHVRPLLPDEVEDNDAHATTRTGEG